MEQLPKIVSQRLQAVNRVEAHPDANLLTAFAEKSLLPLEQTHVLDHLAGCAVCREVVARAQSEAVLEQLAMAPVPGLVPRRSWFQGTGVRWAALAACVVVVGTVVISRARFSQRSPVPVASKNEPVIVAKTEEQPVSSASSPVAPPPPVSRDKELQSKASLSKSPVIAGNKRDEDAELDKQRLAETLPNASGERRQADAPEEALQAKNNKKVDSLGDAVTASRSTTGPVSSPKLDDAKASKREFSAEKAMKAPVVSNEVALARATAAPIPAPPPPPPPAKASPEASLEAQRAKAEPEALAGFYKAKDDGYVARGAAIGRLRSDINPRWQLSAEGKLIRSGDLGKSWQMVQVADKVVFRALCVTDREIWVGGAQGNLFYSSDAGQHWEQVKPSANGQILTADITAIEFKDPQHGKVTTVDHQAWITSDGGHAWQVETR